MNALENAMKEEREMFESLEKAFPGNADVIKTIQILWNQRRAVWFKAAKEHYAEDSTSEVTLPEPVAIPKLIRFAPYRIGRN